MILLTSEQMNATRQSIRNGEWVQGVRTATGRLRSSIHGFRRIVVRNLAGGPPEYADPSPAPIFTDEISPLYVSRAKDLHVAAGLERLFDDVDRQLRGEFRLAGGSYKRVEFGPSDQFSEIEDRHALERLYWAIRFAQAAAFGHPGAVGGLRYCWTKWLQIPHGPVTFATYTVAERIASLSECLFWMQHCTSDLDLGSEIISMKLQVWKDAHRLSANIEHGLGVHNHLLNDARGLFRASRVLPDCDEAAAWREQAFGLWEEFFPKLILRDGTFAEQSSHYQLLLCRTALECFLAAHLSQWELPDGLEKKLADMFQVANDLLRTDGSLPRFGDNSPDHIVEDLWGLMAAASGCGLLKASPRHVAITPLTLLYCGQAPRLPAAVMPSQDSFYPDGGFMFLRSTDESVNLTVYADPRPEALAHGGPGRGSFELWWLGHVIVREPGSILSSSNPRSAWSRSGLAQNVTCLNGLAPAVTSEDRRFLPGSYANQGGAWLGYREREISFYWNGFQRIRQDIVLWRTWQFDPVDNLSFEERIEGSGDMLFESRLCLGDGQWKLTRCESQSSTELQWTGLDGSSATLQLDAPPRVTVTLSEGRYFPEFGVERITPVVVLTGNVGLPIRWTAKWRFYAASSEISSELTHVRNRSNFR